MHTSDALSRLHNFTNTPDQDVIPFKFSTTPYTTIHRTFIFTLNQKSLCAQDKDIRHNSSQTKTR